MIKSLTKDKQICLSSYYKLLLLYEMFRTTIDYQIAGEKRRVLTISYSTLESIH